MARKQSTDTFRYTHADYEHIGLADMHGHTWVANGNNVIDVLDTVDVRCGYVL